MKFGGYQGPDSIHTAAARLFGLELLDQKDLSLEFDLEESILARGLNSGELPNMVASGELDLCYMSLCVSLTPFLNLRYSNCHF